MVPERPLGSKPAQPARHSGTLTNGQPIMAGGVWTGSQAIAFITSQSKGLTHTGLGNTLGGAVAYTPADTRDVCAPVEQVLAYTNYAARSTFWGTALFRTEVSGTNGDHADRVDERQDARVG